MHGLNLRRAAFLGVTSQLALLSGLAASPAHAEPVEYVKVCSVYGVGYQYTPGTEECADSGILGYRIESEIGTLSNTGGGPTVGDGAFSGIAPPDTWGGTIPPGDNAAFGTNAWAGGNPNSGIAMYPPRDPLDPGYDANDRIYAQVYAHFGGVLPREVVSVALEPPLSPDDENYDAEYEAAYNSAGGVFEGDFTDLRYRPGSGFNNYNTTAIGSGAQAGAGGDGQDNATAVGNRATANGTYATALGQDSSADARSATALGRGAHTDFEDGTAVGAAANVFSPKGSAFGAGSMALADSAVALGFSAHAEAENSVALGADSVADQADTVSVGSAGSERKIVNVASGAITATSTDAVTGSQLFNAASDVAAALGGGAAVSASGAWTGPTYTVQGSDHTSVGSALTALDTQVSANADAIDDLQTDVAANADAIDDLQTDVTANADAIDGLQTDVTANTDAIDGLQTDVAANTDAIDDLQTDVSDLEDDIATGAIGLVRQDPDDEAITVAAATGGATVDFAGTDGERRLTGVAAGVMGTDVVNVDQMEAALAAVSAASGAALGDAPLDMGGPEADGTGAYAAGYGAQSNGGSTTAVGTGAQATFEGATAIGAGARATADPTTAVGFFAAATGNNASAFGGNATASGENATAIGESAVASAAGATALGRGATASAANSVALGAGAVASRGAQTDYAALGLADPQTSAGEVSVGTASGARQITNVAAGSEPTDAVNVGQLAGVRAEALAHTDLVAAAFNDGLREARQEAEAGTAAAMAMAGLVQATNPGSSMVTGGVGTWRGSSAIAFGLSHRFQNAWTLKAAGSYAEGGGAGMNAAVGFEF